MRNRTPAAEKLLLPGTWAAGNTVSVGTERTLIRFEVLGTFFFLKTYPHTPVRGFLNGAQVYPLRTAM